jgi:hypothetical protein
VFSQAPCGCHWTAAAAISTRVVDMPSKVNDS